MNEQLDKFLTNNIEKLEKIYNEGIEKNKEGILYINILETQNKIDVIFLNKNQINTIITQDGWEEINNRGKARKICLINNNNNICIVHL